MSRQQSRIGGPTIGGPPSATSLGGPIDHFGGPAHDKGYYDARSYCTNVVCVGAIYSSKALPRVLDNLSIDMHGHRFKITLKDEAAQDHHATLTASPTRTLVPAAAGVR